MPSTTVEMSSFVPWFEFQLAKCLSFELRQLNDTLSFMFGILNFIKSHGNKFPQSGGSPRHSNQSNRKLKIVDQVDSLLSQFGTAPPMLPHSEFIDEFIQKIRKKLRPAEEFEPTVKFSRADLHNEVTTLSLRNVVSTLLAEADALEYLKSKQLISCSYLSEIKSQVHGPLASLLNKYSQLPSVNDSADMYAATQMVMGAESAYASARSAPLFVQIATCKKEAEFIEAEVGEMLKALRQAAKIISKHAVVRRESVWSRSLLPLLDCPTGELLARCCHKSAMENFASSVLELQAVIKNPPQANAPPAVNRRAQLFAEIPDDVVVGIEMFDIELFAAYLDDWRTRVCDIEVRSTTPEFDKRYKELVKLRLNFKKATESYEKKIEMYNDAKSHHNEVRSQLHMMKLKLQEICLSELKEEVEIILPDSKF
eukprot:CAMPEP_0185023812 /NCGR_PEP_ID=MMETSP1103-20130426/6432_1 /TAXON_ID=36769 /ORGANISM="Paraphysomonas bandaiensis, Strain Caron Lab Isolate" /LENGTH=425 /DNA_ID=CAMNT_0027556569 /DNA_START=33 /DNA_END=1310 /DNA_ORIENTATION=+